MSRAVTVNRLSGYTDFTYKLAVTGKYQDMGITTAIAAYPDVAVGCDFNAMI